MTLKEYLKLYQSIIDMSMEMDGGWNEDDDDLSDKQAVVRAIIDCVNDVPARYTPSEYDFDRVSDLLDTLE